MSTLVNTKFRSAIAITMLALASLAPASSAQNTTELRANVPFAFQYGSDHYAAGHYTIRLISDRFVALHGKSRSGFAMVQRNDGGAAAKGKLVFTRYGDRYFLEQIWAPGTDTHLDCVKTAAERRIRKEMTVASKIVHSEEPVTLVAAR
jgi:hypothetical protein